MEINEILKAQINDLLEIINNLSNEFTSHDFLKKYAKAFEREYIDFLSKYGDTGAFQTVHSQIARFLSDNALLLRIEKTQKVLSENIFGEMDEIQGWKKI